MVVWTVRHVLAVNLVTFSGRHSPVLPLYGGYAGGIPSLAVRSSTYPRGVQFGSVGRFWDWRPSHVDFFVNCRRQTCWKRPSEASESLRQVGTDAIYRFLSQTAPRQTCGKEPSEASERRFSDASDGLRELIPRKGEVLDKYYIGHIWGTL